MSTVKTDWQPESEDLARAKDMVKSILGDWDWISWNELLAFDVVLSLRMPPVGGDDPQTVDGVLRVRRNERTLDRWNALGMGPPRTRVGRAVLYRRASARKWLAAQEQPPSGGHLAADRRRFA